MEEAIVLPKDYGFVIAVASASGFFVFLQGAFVKGPREEAEVGYPHMCVYPIETKEEQLYMCAQRGHHNMLETYPSFLAALTTAGVTFPRTSAGLGLIWLIGRQQYGSGYRLGKPEGRMSGAFVAMLSLLLLIVLGTYSGLKVAMS